MSDDFTVNFPTLWVAVDWIERHCVIPDGFHKGESFEMYDWQLWCTVNHYRILPEAEEGQLSSAFRYRRSQVLAPQKSGKGPWSAAIVAAEGLGPVVFAGWAEEGERYRCIDNGCECGWIYRYDKGEPKGKLWSSPLIQVTAASEDQTDNVFRPLQVMLKHGMLAPLAKVGEEFIRLQGDGWIGAVTSSAVSRLGNPITFALQDETQMYRDSNKLRKVAETQRRGAAGMGGRVLETSNVFDPSEDSVAQRTFEATADDVFKFYREPPKHLSYTSKADRHKIHKHVYKGSFHVDLQSIEAEAAELAEHDPAQAERFFGNRIVYGSGSYMNGDKWDDLAVDEKVPDRTQIVLGFDGSEVSDFTALRAETADGYQFTPLAGPDRLPTIWDPAKFGGQIPRSEVDAAVRELFTRYKVVRMYCDPPYWESEIDAWSERFGKKVVYRWHTYRQTQMHAACERLLTDVVKSNTGFRHDKCPITNTHVRNARKSPRPGQRYVLEKPSQTQKIDSCVTSVITHEAAGDASAAGLWHKQRYVYTA